MQDSGYSYPEDLPGKIGFIIGDIVTAGVCILLLIAISSLLWR